MSDLRIASLVPSATEIVAALGQAESIVARSHECDWPPEVAQAPACTRARIDASKPSGTIHEEVGKLLAAALSLYDLDTQVLRAARPSHIVTQDQCDVCAVGLSEVEAAAAEFLEAPVQIVSLAPMRLGDVWDDIARVGTALGIDARPIRDGLLARVAAIAERAKALPRRRVLTVEWSDPPMTAGNWVPEPVSLAGGIDTLGADGSHSPRITVEAVAAADPDAIVLMPCGYDLPCTVADGRALFADPAWSGLRAVQAGAVYATDGNAFFNRPGPRLVESLEILAEIIHPAHFAFGHEGTGWTRLTM
ncbi:MAG: cobalamin-binding protein [Rhodospirillaceae bacterium]|nr:cobalamin-binding protein [Rhodospirillaceae bacterium]